ncbi:hypothetical protein DFQ27_001128, partial [Actinomortierella ambigua]
MATPFGFSSGLFGQPLKMPADRLKLRDGGGETWSAPSSVGGSPAPSSVGSPVGSPLCLPVLPDLPDYTDSEDEQDEVEKAEQEDDEGVGSYGQRDGDDEDGQSFTEGSVVMVTDDDEVEGHAGSYDAYGSGLSHKMSTMSAQWP